MEAAIDTAFFTFRRPSIQRAELSWCGRWYKALKNMNRDNCYDSTPDFHISLDSSLRHTHTHTLHHKNMVQNNYFFLIHSIVQMFCARTFSVFNNVCYNVSSFFFGWQHNQCIYVHWVDELQSFQSTFINWDWTFCECLSFQPFSHRFTKTFKVTEAP